MRQIILDTETTGLDPQEGHRIIEIGCIELNNRRLTDNRFHVYLNPEREIDENALEVHGLNEEFLRDKPLFRDIVDDFMNFIKETEVIIHNAPFDVGFINHELDLLGDSYEPMEHYCRIEDSLVIARKKHPRQRNSLDALCKRYDIDNSRRELHGALLDAEILADVYLSMTGGQLSLQFDDEEDREQMDSVVPLKLEDRPPLVVVRCNEEEIVAHENRLAEIDQASDGACLWKH